MRADTNEAARVAEALPSVCHEGRGRVDVYGNTGLARTRFDTRQHVADKLLARVAQAQLGTAGVRYRVVSVRGIRAVSYKCNEQTGLDTV